MEGACCCLLTRRADFDFRRLEKRSGIRAGWTPNFERLGSGWRISILPSVLSVLWSNEHYYLTHCLFIACIPLLSSNAHIVCMAMAVQDFPGDGASKAVFKIYAATALSSSVSRRHSSLPDGGNEAVTAVQDLRF